MHDKTRRRLKKILIGIGISLSAVVILLAVFCLSVYFGAFGKLPDKNELASINNEEASLVYSADNILIGEFFAQNRTNIHLMDIPVHLKNALIATEDKRFFRHKGFDTRSYFRVFLKSIMLGDKSGGGGSTLTQQLVKNLYGRNDYGFISMPVNKIKEIIIATRIEQVYSKDEVLLLYLNSVPFGEDVYGVETAAHRYFNKSTRDLRIEESAVLVGLLKANTYFNPRLNPENSLARRNMVFRQMEVEHYITAREAAQLRQLPLKLNYENLATESPAGYFVQQVKVKTLQLIKSVRKSDGSEYNLDKDGLKIYTTLNMQVQEMATEAVKTQLTAMQPLLDKELEHSNVKKLWYKKQKQRSASPADDLKKRKVELFGWNDLKTQNISKFDSLWYYYKMLNAAVLFANPKNGDVITWIGGNHFNTLPFDMVMSHRQIASAFKPVLYAAAIENGFGPCTYLQNEVNTYPGYEDWEPMNYNRESTPDSTVALWYALSRSMNLPTIDLYFKLGRDNLINTCNKLKFPKFSSDAPSIALGTLDLSLYEIVRAYAAFADKGEMKELVMINKITDAHGKLLYTRKSAGTESVFTPETTELITAMLQQAINQGTGSSIRSTYGIRSALAGKTGTAENFSNAWFIAYTPDLVMGTWVGARTPDIHFFSGRGSGSALALPIVATVISRIENNAELKNKYLTPFLLSDEAYDFLQCDPYRQNGVKGFFNRLFGKNSKEDPKTKEQDQNDKGVKGFFKRIFKDK